MWTIIKDVLEVVDTHSKNRYIVDYNSPYKEYIRQQYEYR